MPVRRGWSALSAGQITAVAQPGTHTQRDQKFRTSTSELALGAGNFGQAGCGTGEDRKTRARRQGHATPTAEPRSDHLDRAGQAMQQTAVRMVRG